MHFNVGKKKKPVKLSSFSRLFVGEEKDYLIENLAILLASGMDVISALNAIKTEVRTRQMKKIIDSVITDIDSGSYIWRALNKVNLMPAQVISLIKIGEEAGRLAENLRVVALQQQKERAFKAKIRSAMMYPVIVVSLTIIIALGITWFILPKLSQVFNSLDLELPLITKILIATGDFLAEFGFIAMPIFLIFLSAIIYFIFLYSKTRYIGEAILLKLPIIKKLVIQVELARFGFILGTLLKAGLPVVQALNSLEEATSLKIYKKIYKHLFDSIEEGKSFQKSFASYPKSIKYIPSSIQQMIAAGEQSGRLADTLVRIGENYDEKTETTTKNLTVILEPILLIIIWVGVVLIALAIILPIYSLIGGLNKPKNTTTQPVPAPIIEQRETVEIEELEEATAENGQNIATSTLETDKIDELKILSTGFSYLNVRNEPSLDSRIISRVNVGDVYQYIDEEEGWYEVVVEGDVTGWVLGEYVEIIQR